MFSFYKFHGIGNDFILFDGIEKKINEDYFANSPELIKDLCKRRYGIGADGIIFILPSKNKGNLSLEYNNSDQLDRLVMVIKANY